MAGRVKPIVFSRHAEAKFGILRKHGFVVHRETITTCLRSPDKIDTGYKGRTIAQKAIDKEHVIRVIFEDIGETIRIVTFYPGRRERYEN